MHDEPIQPPVETEPEAPDDAEEKAPPLQSLKLPSVQHTVQPWITGEPVAVVNRAMRPWWAGMFREPLVNALIAVGVSLLGGLVQIVFDPNLQLAKVLASVPIFGVVVFCFSIAIPSEVRITTDGVGVLDWREAAKGWPGRFFQNQAEPELAMIASGTYLTAPGREPVRVRLPRFAAARAARLSGLRLTRAPSWWMWMLLSWPGLFLWCALPFQSLGGAMMILGLVIRTFSRLTSGEAEEELLTRP